jgi:hypothetical protein
MADGDKRGVSELTELMGEVLQSHASEAFGEFMVRNMALGDMAPGSGDAVVDGIDASPDGGDAMARAHLASLPEDEREQLVERAAMETGRRLHAAAVTLIEARAAARLPVAITPDMVAVAAITELGDSR